MTARALGACLAPTHLARFCTTRTRCAHSGNNGFVVWLSWLAVALIVFVAIYVVVYLVALAVRGTLELTRARRARREPSPARTLDLRREESVRR